MTAIWYIFTIISSLALSGFLLNILGQLIAKKPSISIAEADYIMSQIKALVDWYIDESILNKILIFVLAAAIILGLTFACKLDDKFQDLPGGELLENLFGESPLKELNPLLRLIPGALFAIYIFVRMAISLFWEDVKFDFVNFSLLGKNYSAFQWITQIFYFLIIATLIWLIFEAFLSAGFIGGIFHTVFVISANLLMLFVGFLIGAMSVIALILLFVIVAVIISFLITITIIRAFIFRF